MAEAVMGPLLGMLQELVTKEVRAMAAVNNDVRILRDKLMWMQAFLRDLEPRRRARNDELTRVCLRQIRDAVFDAEDAIDLFILQVDLSRYQKWTQRMVNFLMKPGTQLCVRQNLSSRIASINERLEGIIQNKDKYKIDGGEDSSPVTAWRPSTAMSDAAAAGNLGCVVLPFVGRGEDEKRLKELLYKESEYPMVVTVAGKSGVGKTKLVKKVYEEYKTKAHFHKHAWASFAPNLSASNIKRLVLFNLTHIMFPKDEVEEKLKAELRGEKNHKYLLVLDGEVGSSEWSSILSVLSGSHAGSRVVRITHMGSEQPHKCFNYESIELRHFNQKASIDLFVETLSTGSTKVKKDKDDDNEWIEEVKKKYSDHVYNATGGLPLAIVLLSGLLRTKEYPGEWMKVFKHLKTEGTKQKRVDFILSMCYDDLPHDLKSCFLYFAIFPVNMLVRARTMVSMWMAEGFLRPKEGKSMEKVGWHYLSELVHRCLMNVPPVEDVIPGSERVTVQSKVHEFLLLEAHEGTFAEVHDGDDVSTQSTTRRLSLQNNTDKDAALAAPLPKLRSIFSTFQNEDQGGSSKAKVVKKPRARACPWQDQRTGGSGDIMRGLLQGSKFLRVIHLHGLEIGAELPHEIGNVVHLQYLAVTSCSLEVIPTSIGKLTRLQTLDVRSTKVSKLPPEFWKIRALRNVFGVIVLPRRVGHLDQLQNLTKVNPGADNSGCWDRKTFKSMVRLHTLSIEGTSAKNMVALSAIYDSNYLVVLSIRGKVIPLDLFTKSNFQRLQVMRLNGRIEPRSSNERFTLMTVTKLRLKNTMVSQGFIDMLSRLPLLAVLNFHDKSCEKDITFPDGFNGLTELTLELEMERIEISTMAFPHLEKLEILVYSNDIRSIICTENKDIWAKLGVDVEHLANNKTHDTSTHGEEASEDYDIEVC